MKFYFLLQYKRIHRHIKDFGVSPVIAYGLIGILFYWGSVSFYESVLLPHYFYTIIAIVVVFISSSIKHNDAIKQYFSQVNYRKITGINHVLLATPFVLFLIYRSNYKESVIVYAASILLSFIKKPNGFSFVIPSPFYKWPFEFIIGFRKIFWVFIAAYGLAVISVYVDNFNLGISSIILVLLICSSFYTKQDSDYYIWIHAMKPKEFLKYKMKIAVGYSLMLTVPILLILSVAYLHQFHVVLIFEILGIVFVLLYVLLKYAFKGEGVGILQALIGGLCLLFPPALLIVVPYFYTKAIRNLNSLLA